MRCAIVGHGPSLLRGERGKEIDSYDCVIRLKRSWQLLKYPLHYGSRVDIALGSLKTMPAMAEGWPGVRLWAFQDTRTEDWPPETWTRYGAECSPLLCRHLIERYRAIRGRMVLDDAQTTKGALSDDHGHLHPSAGMFSIAMAMHDMQLSELALFGFDSLVSGVFDWSVTRGPDYREYPDHNWQAEARLLRELATEHGMDLDSTGVLYAA